MNKKLVEGIAVEKIAQGGDGLGFLPDGRVLFIEGAFPGDVVDVELARDKKTWARGRAVAIKEPSSAREPVACPGFERGCGGCRFWGVAYEQELAWKVEAAQEAMERISKLDLPEPSVVQAPSVEDYRNRVTFHQRYIDGEVRLGFYAAATREVVEIDRCPVARTEIDEVLAEASGVLGLLGRCDITVETAGDGEAVLSIELGKRGRIKHHYLDELADLVDRTISVRGVEIFDESGKHYVMGDATVAAEEVLAQSPVAAMRVAAGQFRQSNQAVNRLLVDHVQAVAEAEQAQPNLLELYCGSGNFSFALAPHVTSLMGFEGSAKAVDTARQFAGLNGELDHLHFRVADLSDPVVIEQILEDHYDAVVLDPPREGAAEVATALADGEGPQLVVYISCDPACLARDLATLSGGGWSVEDITYFDMFPRTAHIETVAVLRRGSNLE